MIKYVVIGMVIGYIFGCCQTGYFVGKLNRIDIRDYGSGNSGTTNTLRVLGKKAALFTFLGDALKGVFTVLIARFWLLPHVSGINPVAFLLLAGFVTVLGHNFPIIMKFKGGKGIATTGGVFFAVDPRMALICLAVFIAVTAASRYVSLGSICMVTALPFILYFFYGYQPVVLAVGIIYAVMAIWQHRANIGRLIHGNENKLGQKVK